MIGLKLKAGALQLTMYVVVVVALLLTGFILFTHTHKRFTIQSEFVKETVNNADRGVHYALLNHLKTKDTTIVHLNDEDYKSLHVHKDYWGLFEKLTAVSKIKSNTFKKIALVGDSQSNIERTALYIKDNNRPLVVVGQTHIQGASYLPKQGIRTGNISGHSYYGNQLIYGTTKTSKPNLPQLSSELLKELQLLKKKINTVQPSQFIDLNSKKAFKNSFFNQPQLAYSANNISLSDVYLTGHIIVQSKTKITLEATATLKDVILIAPEIEIKPYCKGTFQAIASKKLLVGRNCSLDYPSALYLNDQRNFNSTAKNGKDNCFIKIDKGSSIKGIIAYLGTIKNYKPQVFIDEDADIVGEVYCNKNLELLGTVKGSVFTSNFIANQSGSAYQNHIYNAVINSDELPEAFVGLLFKDSKKGIAKWLY